MRANFSLGVLVRAEQLYFVCEQLRLIEILAERIQRSRVLEIITLNELLKLDPSAPGT